MARQATLTAVFRGCSRCFLHALRLWFQLQQAVEFSVLFALQLEQELALEQWLVRSHFRYFLLLQHCFLRALFCVNRGVGDALQLGSIFRPLLIRQPFSSTI